MHDHVLPEGSAYSQFQLAKNTHKTHTHIYTICVCVCNIYIYIYTHTHIYIYMYTGRAIMNYLSKEFGKIVC